MRCPWCGNRNRPDAQTCASCEKDLAEEQSTDQAIEVLESLCVEDPQVTCPACGAINIATAGFCTLCNHFLLPRPTSKRSPKTELGHLLSLEGMQTAIRTHPARTLLVAAAVIVVLSIPPALWIGDSLGSAIKGARPTTASGSDPDGFPQRISFTGASQHRSSTRITIPIPPHAQQQTSRKGAWRGSSYGSAVWVVPRPYGSIAAYYRMQAMSPWLWPQGWHVDYDGPSGRLTMTKTVEQSTIGNATLTWRASGPNSTAVEVSYDFAENIEPVFTGIR